MSSPKKVRHEFYTGTRLTLRIVANLGFLERENAAILNASILSFARTTIKAFQKSMSRAALSCPLFITQNDGTVLQANLAARLPIRTFASGPTNSICGAAFLAKETREMKESMLVVDIGWYSAVFLFIVVLIIH